jgi:membrane-associated phospholipid phosphatase
VTGSRPGPGPRAEGGPADELLREPAAQRYVGSRDLTHWPSRLGRFLVTLARRLHRQLTPAQVLAVTLVAGLLVVAAATTLAGSVYDAVVEQDGIAGLDRPALDGAMSVRTSFGNGLVKAWTTVGGPVGMPILATVVAVTLAVLWRQWTPIVLVAATAAGSLLLTVVGKDLVGRARPPLVDAVPPYELSASFPSGHSLNAAAIGGIVAYLVLRRQRSARARALTVAAAVAFAVTMGLSRVYLGHHWLTDVLAAWALGVAWLAVVVTAHRLLLTLHRRA